MTFSERRVETLAHETRGDGAVASGIKWRSAGECLKTSGDAAPMLDQLAKSAYERRLLELREAREAAEARE
jgi:hypothetical protein